MTNTPKPNFVPRPAKENAQPLPDTQAARVFAKFGGVPSLFRALKALGAKHARHISVIYRWNLPAENGGTHGMIPSAALKSVLLAARREGIVLMPEDLYPLKG